ncbi:MAG: TonB-dependent receptor, partial [Muribaculaceae bacterium]|nr:TonB-dependent receptor [Muribaculaceae bacterium]
HSFERLWFMPSELIAGVEYDYNYLHDVTLSYDHDVAQRVHIYSGYFQNEWRTDRWGFLVGARVDNHSLIDNPILSPRANIRFNPSDKFNFRLSYSTGFRSPQAYDEDFHVAIVGGERVVTILAKDLKEESSQSVSASADMYLRLGNVPVNILVEGFYTDLRDVFALRSLDEPDDKGNAVLERYNGSGARVAGVNLEAKFMFSSKWQLQGGATWQRSRYKRPEVWSEDPDVPVEKRMFRTPDFYGYFMLNADLMRNFHASLSGTYTGSMLVQHMAGSGTPIDCAVTTPRFFDANLKLTYEFKIFKYACLEVNAGIQNMFNSYQRDFDIGATRDSGYIYGPSLPRSLFAGFKLHI